MTKEEMKNRISMALKAPILQQGFECICKENAELKEKLGDKVMQDQKDKADLVWKLKTANEQKASQLAYAKTIIKDLLDNSDEYARQRAEDFLKGNK